MLNIYQIKFEPSGPLYVFIFIILICYQITQSG